MQIMNLNPTRLLQVPRNKAPKWELLRTNSTTKKSSLLLTNNEVVSIDELQVQQIIEKQSKGLIPRKETNFDPHLLSLAYETCRQICAVRSTTYYLGSLLMTEERKKAVWAVYGWGQITDEIVDKASNDLETSTMLDSWERRLEDIFDGRPHDLMDTALADAVQRFSLDIQPFKGLMKGMKMDTWKTRYENFEELELYCYYVAVTGCLMAIPIAGISLESEPCAKSIYEGAFALGMANQLTNILRDVKEDASRGRIYLPQDELKEYGLTEEDIFSSNVTDKWREFTKMQIERARSYYAQGEYVASHLQVSSRWPVWASMMLYKKILDKIEENNYDNLTKRATVGTGEKLLTLPLAYAKAMGWCPNNNNSALLSN